MTAGKHGIEEKRKEPSALRIVLIVLIVVLTGVFAVSGYMLAKESISDAADKSAFDELAEIKKRSAEKAENPEKPGKPADMGEKDTSGNETDIPPDDAETEPDDEPGGSDIVMPTYKELAAMNSDLFGWVTIEDTPIDYPVMFTPKNPEYYLRKGFNKKYSYSGVPFMDGNCKRDGNHYLIYGHNMKNQTMFGTLPKYLKKDYWQKHQIISFDTLTESREYQIMAVFRSKAYSKDETGVFRYYNYVDISKQERFESYVKNVLRESAFQTGITAEWGDELLTLSTCDYYTENGRLVVVAKRIK